MLHGVMRCTRITPPRTSLTEPAKQRGGKHQGPFVTHLIAAIVNVLRCVSHRLYTVILSHKKLQKGFGTLLKRKKKRNTIFIFRKFLIKPCDLKFLWSKVLRRPLKRDFRRLAKRTDWERGEAAACDEEVDGDSYAVC